VLASYDNNQAGQLAAAGGDAGALERRELGDAADLVDIALGYRLGSEQKAAVDGAEHAGDWSRCARPSGGGRSFWGTRPPAVVALLMAWFRVAAGAGIRVAAHGRRGRRVP
jgi:hypothetical protein